jgi:hypothetical protein
MGRRPCGALRRPAAACLAAAVALLLHASAALGATFVGDKQALLAFKEGMRESSLLLADWSEDTDPCGDGWTGIKCDCKDFFYSVGNSMVRAAACSPPRAGMCQGQPLQASVRWSDGAALWPWGTASLVLRHGAKRGIESTLRMLPLQVCSPPPALPNNITRVLQINFGDPRITQWNTLKGKWVVGWVGK